MKGCTIAGLKAHIGTEGNEATDEAAKQGEENSAAKFKTITLPQPANYTKNLIDNAVREIWNTSWQSAPHYKHTKHFYSGPDKQRTSKITSLSRSHLSKLITIITGFNCLSYKQFKSNPEINPLCRLGSEANETFWHFIRDFPRLKTIRDEIFLDKPPEQDRWKAK